MSTYYIDKNIIGVLLEIEDSEKRDLAYMEYFKRLVIISIEEIESYFDATESDPIVAKERSSEMVIKIFGANDPTLTDQITPEDIYKNAALPSELKEKIKSVVNQLNKFIYESYSATLTEDKKKSLNEYIEGIEKQAQETAGYLKSVMNTVQEVMKEDTVEETSSNAAQSSFPKVSLTSSSSN